MMFPGLMRTAALTVLRKGTLEKDDDLMAKDIKDPGAALLTNQR